MERTMVKITVKTMEKIVIMGKTLIITRLISLPDIGKARCL